MSTPVEIRAFLAAKKLASEIVVVPAASPRQVPGEQRRPCGNRLSRPSAAVAVAEGQPLQGVATRSESATEVDGRPSMGFRLPPETSIQQWIFAAIFARI